MQFENAFIDKLETISLLCKSVGIDTFSVLISEQDPSKIVIRGLDVQRTAVVFDVMNKPTEFIEIAIPDVNEFISRYKILKNSEGEINNSVIGKEYVKLITFDNGTTKVSYRCKNAKSAVPLLNINENFNVSVNYDVNDIKILQEAANAMGTEYFYVDISNGLCKFILYDVNNDSFEHTLITRFDESTKLKYKYPVKQVLSLMRLDKDNDTFTISDSKGLMNMLINGINVYVLPNVS